MRGRPTRGFRQSFLQKPFENFSIETSERQARMMRTYEKTNYEVRRSRSLINAIIGLGKLTSLMCIC